MFCRRVVTKHFPKCQRKKLGNFFKSRKKTTQPGIFGKFVDNLKTFFESTSVFRQSQLSLLSYRRIPKVSKPLVIIPFCRNVMGH